tara:strand:- start:2343 stop:2987 length:645 start_codon:yes stop_codon:yes gene_type:complete
LTVLIEGLDLAGKSTLWRGLEKNIPALGYELRQGRNSLCKGNQLARQADAMRRDPNRNFQKTSELFLAAHRWDAEHFVSPPRGTIHLQDSCWMRTLAFARFASNQVATQKLKEAARSFPAFDLVIFLTASIDIRRERLAKREREEPGANDAGDAWVNSRPEDFLRLEGELKGVVEKFAHPVVIDTTDLDPGTILNLVSQELKRALDTKTSISEP